MVNSLSEIPWEEANRPCALCGTSDSRLKHVFQFPALPRNFDLRECDQCGLLFNSPRLTDLTPLYAEKYYVFHETENKRYAQALGQIKRHLDPSLCLPDGPLDVLEVGSAKGHLLHVLRHLGHTVQGVELSSSAAKSAREQFGLEVFEGSIEQYVSESGGSASRHDVVWCNDVLEHVPDPVGFVQQCAVTLKPGGRLILDTPNGGAQAVRENKPNWGGYNPYHIYLFGPMNIELLLDKAGFQIHTKFSYHNDPSISLVAPRPLRSFLRNSLDAAGVLGLLRRMRYRRLRQQDGTLIDLPMSDEEINRRLEEIPWFSGSDDARDELSSGCRGNNLVVHAVKT